MFIREIRSFIKRAILLCLLVVSLIFLCNSLLQRPSVQKEILKRISNAIGYDIDARDIEIDLWKGLGISINKLSARSRQGDKRFNALNVRVDLDVKQLIGGHIVPDDLYLTKPEIVLPWEEGYSPGAEIKGFLPEKIPLFLFPDIHYLTIEKGRVIFTGASFTLDDFYLRAVSIGSSETPEFRIISRGQIGYQGKTAGFEVNGRVKAGDPLYVDIKVNMDNAPLSWFKWPARIPVKEGSFKTRMDVTGAPVRELSVKGSIDLAGLSFDIIKKDRDKSYFFPALSLKLQSEITKDNIKAPHVKINGEDLSVDLGLVLDLKEGGPPYLDLSFNSEFMGVETFKSVFPSPLLPQWLEGRVFPIFTGGEIRVNKFSLKGDIDQIRHMPLPENRSVMELLFECRGFEASGGGIRLPFKDASAEIALKDGLFSVSGLKAGFGDSAIKDSGMDIKDVFDPSRFYEFHIDGDFNIKDLLSQKEMDVVPEKASARLEKLPDMTGRLVGKATIGYQHGWDGPSILSGDFLLNGFSLEKKDLVFPIIFDEARIHIDDTGADYISGSGSWGNNSFNLSANFGIDRMAPHFTNGLLSANVDMDQVFSIFKLKGGEALIFPDTLSWDVSFARDEQAWSLKGHVDPGDTAVKLGNFIIKASGTYNNNIVFDLGISPDDKRIDLKSVLLNMKDSSIKMTGAYDMKARRFDKINLDSSGLSMKDLSVTSNKREVFSEGRLKGVLDISMAEGTGATVVAGHGEGAGLSFLAGTNSKPISGCSFQADFSRGGVRLNSLNMTTGKSNFSITGDIRGWSELTGDLKVHSDYLNFSDIMPGEDASSRNTLMDHLNLLIQMDVSKGRWRKLDFGPAQAELSLEGGNVFVKESHVHLEHGDLKIKGHVKKVPEAELSFTGDVSIKDQPVDTIMEGIGITNNSLKGSLDLEGSLSVRGREKKELLSGLNGSVNILLTKGLIKNPSVFIKVLDFLSLQKIFEQRPPDLKGEGLYFESISVVDGVIGNGVITSHNMVMRSPVMNAVADGKADLPGKKIDLLLGVQPHGTIDSLVSKVPIVGYIITGETKSIVTYPFEVKGPFSGPDVTFVPFDTLEGGVVGILKRLILTPVRILNKIDKTLNNDGKNSAP